MIEPSLMRMLLAVSDAGGLGRASERLGLTQQAVSAQVRRLEAMVGRPLLERTSRGTSLTAAGEAMVAFARRAIALEDEVRRHFADVRTAGTLRIGVSEGFAATGLPVLLRALNLAKPDLEIWVMTGRTPTLEAAIDGETIDVAIGLQRSGEGRGEAILRDAVRWMGDPEALQDRASAVRLAAHPAPSVLRAMMLEALSAAGRIHAVTFESESQSSLRAAAVAGIAIGCFAFEPVESQLDDPFSTTALPPLGEVEIFVRRRHGASEAAEALLAVLRDQARHLPLPGRPWPG